MHLDSPAGRARASPAPPGRAPGACRMAAYLYGLSSRTPRGLHDVCVLLRRRARADPSAARRRRSRRPAPLRVQFDAYTRCAWSLCRALARHRAAVWTLWLASSRVTVSLRAVTRTSRATCPAIAERERSTLERKKGLVLFCETGGRSAASHVDLRYLAVHVLHTTRTGEASDTDSIG